jgi:CMP-N,N'-diacetyllegionaminic acid synthase
MKILAIIPARGGSKGIHLKNIVSLAGKPLISYSIEAAKKSKLITRIVVSTDNKKIAQIAKKYGADVPFYRPKKISGDKSLTSDVIKYTLNYLEKNESYVPDIVVLLQPTSPLRKYETIDKAIRKLKREKTDIVLEISKIQSHPYRSFLPNGKFLKPFKKNFLKYHQRQLFPKFYYPTGDLYVFWSHNLQKFGNIYGSKIQGIIKSENEIGHDINNLFDLFICEMKIKYWKQYQKQITSFKN